MIIEKEQLIPHIIDLFESACIKQLESLECEIERTEAPRCESAQLSSHIYAHSPELRIDLRLHTPKSMLRSTMPGQDTKTITESMLEDWVKELSNRFLGRLKNKLVDHNCVLQMGFPDLCEDEPPEALSESSAKRIELNFKVSGEMMGCCIYVNIINPDLIMEEYEDEDEDWFSESELEHLE